MPRTTVCHTNKYYSKMPLNGCFSCLQFQSDEVITKLDFSNIVLTDAFPDVWQYERTLEELQLASTRINTLPPQLFYCQGLRVLIVNNNGLESVPNAIGSLRHLQTLNLSRNLISNVPDSIKTCKNLTHLDLSYNNLQRLPDALTRLISLQELLLNETYLEFLPANFGRLINLRILELRLNNLITLPKSMVRLCNLHRLDIGGNEFSELPEVIGELKQLRELWVDFNQINRISGNVGKLRELLHFEANGNLISLLPNELCNWRSIEVLSMCTNNLETFPFSMGMLRSLVTLKCEMNELRELPDSISNLENLEELVLSHNKLLRLPTTIGMLRKLSYLFVDDNELHALPDEICSCNNLCVLSVNRNKIIELPQNIGRLHKLKVLNLVKNYICILPVSILSLVNLTSLWISDNQSQPLVPLQYVDVNTKTELTCFMLPQTGKRAEKQKQPQNNMEVQETYTNQHLMYNTAQQLEEQRRMSADSYIDSCTSPTRRSICFAEKATIMSDTPKTTYVVSVVPLETDNERVLYGQNATATTVDNMSNLLTYAYDSSTDNTIGNGGETTEVGVRLMRSPTPYPKELRLMAKYVRNGQKSSYTKTNDCELNVKEARVLLNNISNNNNSGNNVVCDTNGEDMNTQKNFEQGDAENKSGICDTINAFNLADRQQSSDAYEAASVHYTAGEHYPQPQERMQQLQQQQQPEEQLWQDQQTVAFDVQGGEKFYTAYYVTPHHINSLFAKNIAPPYHQLLNQYQQQSSIAAQQQNQQQQQQQQLDLPNTYYIDGDRNSLSGTPSIMQPPPYHIARVFTKKTPEDLTNYETMRNHQQQLEYEKIKNEQAITLSTASATVEIASKNTQLNSNSPIPNEFDAQNNVVEQFHTGKSKWQQQQETDVINSKDQTPDENSADITDSTSQHQRHQLEPLNGSLSQLSITSANSINTNSITDNSVVNVHSPGAITNINNSKLSNRYSTNNSFNTKRGKKMPWLFGVHKNPTVIQVTLKVEHQIGFDISELPNKEGIFVSFTVPNSAAARVLCTKDKLLEIDGHDFTNINLSDAKKVILNAGAIMNIMLSRK